MQRLAVVRLYGARRSVWLSGGALASMLVLLEFTACQPQVPRSGESVSRAGGSTAVQPGSTSSAKPSDAQSTDGGIAAEQKNVSSSLPDKEAKVSGQDGAPSGNVSQGEKPGGQPRGVASQSVENGHSAVAGAATGSAGGEPAPVANREGSAQTPARRLYLRHCAPCHGERGDGVGVAAAQLFPRPRNFRTGRFRLVSTSNNVPTREDLRSVLLRGMPGSAMVPWPHLTEAERELLIDEVLAMRREGAIEQYAALLKEQEGLSDEQLAEPQMQDEIRHYVDESLVPGETTPVPPIGEPTAEAIARGRQVYLKFGCVPCHGEQGRGDGIQKMLDDDKLPTRPRDFTAGIFKGQDDPASLYRRIAYGMPGTPMPGSTQMTPAQMVDLVHYILSLSTPQQRASTVLNRQTIDVATVSVVPDDLQAIGWDNIPSYVIRLTPLWWRDEYIKHVEVQAVHDAQAIAVRVTWQDGTPDEQALRHEAFRDALAIEWYVGKEEPFLGMGSPESPVELWFWDARRQSARTLEDEYPRIVGDVYPFSESVVESPDGTRAAADSRRQPALAVPARAVGNRIAPDDPVGDSAGMVAGGPGSVTFRLAASRIVEITSHRQQDRWTVYFRRPLRPTSPEDGLPLLAGQPIAVAFAVWDGSRADRNGQKMVSIWQPVVLK